MYSLMILALVLLLLCYQFGFRKTILAYDEYLDLKNASAAEFGAVYQPDYNKRMNANLDRILDFYKADTTSLRNGVINRIAVIAQKANVKIIDVPPPDPNRDSSAITIQKLSFRGSFFSLLKVLDTLQQTSGLGFVRYVEIGVGKSRLQDQNDKMLNMKIFLSEIK